MFKIALNLLEAIALSLRYSLPLISCITNLYCLLKYTYFDGVTLRFLWSEPERFTEGESSREETTARELEEKRRENRERKKSLINVGLTGLVY